MKLSSVSLSLLCLAACATTKVEQEQDERRRLSIEMFRELIEEGTLSPTNSMGDSFETIGTELGDDAYLEEVLRTYQDRTEELSAASDEGLSAASDEGEGEALPLEEPEQVVAAPIDTVNPYAEFGTRILVHEGPDGCLLYTSPSPRDA